VIIAAPVEQVFSVAIQIPRSRLLTKLSTGFLFTIRSTFLQAHRGCNSMSVGRLLARPHTPSPPAVEIHLFIECQFAPLYSVSIRLSLAKMRKGVVQGSAGNLNQPGERPVHLQDEKDRPGH